MCPPMTTFESEERRAVKARVSVLIALAAAVLITGSITAGVALAVLVTLYLTRARWALPTATLDEGGVRITGPMRLWRRYLPFSEIEAVELVEASRLVLTGATGGPSFSWRAASVSSASALYAEIGQRLDTRRAWSESGFERNGLGLDDWQATLATRFSAAGSAYRAHFELESTLSLLGDIDAPIDARAGAAFVLLSSRDPRAVRAALGALGPSSPPLVVALASLAAGDPKLRDRAESLLGFLPWRDRAEWTASCTPPRRARAPQPA